MNGVAAIRKPAPGTYRSWRDRVSNEWLGWGVFVAICFIFAGIGAWFTAGSVKTWYPTLLKPPGTPPAWVFGPVWTTLYMLMATAAWLVWRQRAAADVKVALALFFAQLILNATWSWVFFGLRRPGLALMDILLLLAAITTTMVDFERLSRLAFWLMAPYIAWVCYATFLNFGIWRLNRGVG